MSFGRGRTPKAPYDAPALYDYTVKALGRQMRSVAGLKRLLRLRVAGQQDADVLIEAVVLKLKEQRYLNDTDYAAAYSAYRKENEKFGKLRVISDLKTKGVHNDIIEKTVRTAYQGVSEEKLAREFLSKKRLRKPANAKDAARIFRALARAGFASRTIFEILKKWDVEDEVLSAFEAEQEESGNL
jgi:regulatory protein